MLTSLLAAFVVFAIPAAAPDRSAPDATAASRNPRVRPYDGRSASLLLRGIERSTTLRLIVERLERSNVITYVEMQPALRQQLAGRMVWLTATGTARYVRISLNPELASETLVAVLGHELQHALEVAESPAIVDEASLETYYRKYGIQMRVHTSGYDTQAARDAGDLVRRELASSAAPRVIESILPFDASTWHIVYRRARDRAHSR
jgi:hypothetical protein